MRGTHSITRTHLRVTGRATLEWWEDNLQEQGMRSSGVIERDGRLTLDFEDPEGQRLSLVDDGGTGPEPQIWQKSSVSAEHQIRGLGPIIISVPSITDTDRVLTQALNMRQVRDYSIPDGCPPNVHVYEMGEADHTRSCMWRFSRSCRSRGRERGACTTWRSAHPTRRSTTPGPIA